MLEKGEVVQINLPGNTDAVVREMLYFDGKITTIEEVVRKSNVPLDQYILKGCKSKRGMPFFFLEEWLERV